MKTLHLYLTRQVLATLVMTVFVCTFILLMLNGLKEILELLVKREATVAVVGQAVLLLIPWVLAYALPMGMLTAALMVFGRFSADQELTAVRASGVSLISLTGPVLLLSVVLSGVCGWINCYLAPTCRVAYNQLIYQATKAQPGLLLQPNEYLQLGTATIFAEKVHADGTNLENVIVYETKAGELCRWLKAPAGTIRSDPANEEIVLTLNDATGSTREAGAGWVPLGQGGELPLPFKLPTANETAKQVAVSDMTFRQLRRQLADIEQASSHTAPIQDASPEALKAERQAHRIAHDLSMPVLVQIHREVAFSFACFGFTLVGIQLGIRAHRRETSIGIAIALVLVLVYYCFMIVAQAWSYHPERAPHLILWLPNFIFQAVGAVMLWKANKG